MRFSKEAMARMGEAMDPLFASDAIDRETLVAIAMGFAVPMEAGGFCRPSPEARALAQEMVRSDAEAYASPPTRDARPLPQRVALVLDWLVLRERRVGVDVQQLP